MRQIPVPLRAAANAHHSEGRYAISTSEFSEDEVARYWDQNAETWTEEVRRGQDVCREYWNNPAFFAFLGSVEGKEVLDAGCGEGYNTRLLAQAGARITGVDISRKMVDSAREEERRRPLGIRYEVTSFADLSPFEDGSFDLVVSFMALMDGPDYAGALREALRVLRPEGELVFSITHPCFMTRGFGWVVNERREAVKLTVSSYFNSQPWLERWGFGDPPAHEEPILFVVPAFPRTLSHYVNHLVRAGFVLREIEEPRPPEDACARHPFMRGWRDHAALFLYVRAVKPG